LCQNIDRPALVNEKEIDERVYRSSLTRDSSNI
jgi:hypothetical protein